MVLEVGQGYTANNGITTVIQGAIALEQQDWWGKNRNEHLEDRTRFTCTPAQILYLALCKNGFNLPEALTSCGLTEDEATKAQQALKIRDADGKPRVNDDGIVTQITRPSFVGADLEEYDLQGVDLRGANLEGALLRYADLRGADLRGADLRGAELWMADISGADLEDVKNLKDASSRYWAFYCQDNPPKNLAGALNEVTENMRPIALTKQEYDKVYRLRNSNNSSAFWKEVSWLRGECNTRINSREQVNAAVDTAKAKFAWCQPLVSTNVAIMFSPGFDKTTRAAWYGNGAGGNVLQGISHGLEFLAGALNDKENKRPMDFLTRATSSMALTRQESDKVYRLRDSHNSSAFWQELSRLRGVCSKRIDSREQVDAAKAKFAWCQPLVSTNVAIMFSPGFDKTTRAAWYGEGAGGKVLQGISNRLEVLNHLVGRGSR